MRKGIGRAATELSVLHEHLAAMPVRVQWCCHLACLQSSYAVQERVVYQFQALGHSRPRCIEDTTVIHSTCLASLSALRTS
jgi:hypothetical protein